MDRAPADRNAVFPLFELLEVAPGVFAGNLLPALEPRHQAALALTCTQLRAAVQQNVTTLSLRAGSCCLSREHMLGAHMPNVRQVVLQPGNLHEAMFVLPLFLLQAARAMTSLTSLQLHDLLPDRPPEEIQCTSCSAWASTYDLSAILASAGHCIPHLASLDFSTHYVSDAECAAIALMTGLTRLQLRSVHGTHIGGLSRLSALPSLSSLSLSDTNYSSRMHDEDLAMLLAASSLTHLAIAPHNLTKPLLLCLAEMHEPDWQAVMAQGPPTPQQRTPGAAAAAGAAAGGAAGVRDMLRAALAAHNVADAGAAFNPSVEGQLPPPPPLLWLRVALHPGPRFERALASACNLTRLTRLELGWTPVPHDARPLDMTPNWPEATQQQLGHLTALRELALGWTPTPGVLAALAPNSTLTCLHLGGLFSALPEPPAVARLRLPSIIRLAAHMETPPHVLAAGDAADPEPLGRAQCVAALAAFPGLTRLELTGRLYGPALAELPDVLPADKLRELLLPQRLSATTAQLSGLRRLHGLTSLRLGWRSVHHAGPAGYTPAGFDPQQQGEWPLSLAALVGLPEDALPGHPPAWSCAASATSSGGGQGGAPAAAGSVAGGAGAAAVPPALAAAAGNSSNAAGAASCSLCGAPLAKRCLCRGLRRLEVVGPLAPRELHHLRSLPALRQLVLRHNPSWSSGLAPSALAVIMTQLTQLECYRCSGVDGHQLEELSVRIAPALGADPFGCRVKLVPRGGVTAAELGRGYQHMGVTLLACEELGLMPDEVAGDVYTSEQLAPEPEPPQQPQPDDGGVAQLQQMFAHPLAGMQGFGHGLHWHPVHQAPIPHHPPPGMPPWAHPPHFAHLPPPPPMPAMPPPPVIPPPNHQQMFDQIMADIGAVGGVHVQGGAGGVHVQHGPGGVHVQVGHGQGPQGLAQQVVHHHVVLPGGGVMMINAPGGAAAAAAAAAAGGGQHAAQGQHPAQGAAGPAHVLQWPGPPHVHLPGAPVGLGVWFDDGDSDEDEDDSDADEDDVAGGLAAAAFDAANAVIEQNAGGADGAGAGGDGGDGDDGAE